VWGLGSKVRGLKFGVEGQLVHPQRTLVHRPLGCSGFGVWGVGKVEDFGCGCGVRGGWGGWVSGSIPKDPSFIAPGRGLGREFRGWG